MNPKNTISQYQQSVWSHDATYSKCLHDAEDELAFLRKGELQLKEHLLQLQSRMEHLQAVLTGLDFLKKKDRKKRLEE